MPNIPYDENNPPPNCLECYFYGETYSPTLHNHTYWYDYCKNLNRHFAKMHIILRGEFRKLSNHDVDDLKKTIPYECPYFDKSKAFWEMYWVTTYTAEYFVELCSMYPQNYKDNYVYSLEQNILVCQSGISTDLNLHYLICEEKNREWFVTTFGGDAVLVSERNPEDFPDFKDF